MQSLTPTNSRLPPQKFWLCLAAVMLVLAALSLRILGAWNDLWFDEIISIKLANQVSGWQGIFTEFKYDNNHYLNSFWVYALGSNRHELLYRIPAIAAGMATIVAAYWTLKPFGKTAQIIAAILIAFSHLQIHYSSEARGYAFHLLFAVLAFGCLDRFHRTDRFRYAWSFGLFATLALLSHLLTINFLLACGIWSVSFQTKRPISKWQQLSRLLSCHLLPLAAGIALYLVNVRELEFGGGPKYNTLFVLTSAWSLLVGVASPGALRVATGVFALGLTIASLRLHQKLEKNETYSSESWKFYLAFLVLIPLARIVIPSSLLFTRYFLLQITFALLLLSVIASDMLTRPGNRSMVWAMITLYVGLNFFSTSRLVMYGRGSYQETLQSMIEKTEGDQVTLGSSNLILDKPVIDYFVRQSDLDPEELLLLEATDLPEWYIEHRTMDCATDISVPPLSIQIRDHEYRLQLRSQASFLSGFEWNCYQKK